MGILDWFSKSRSSEIERRIERELRTYSINGSLVSLDDNDETYIKDGYNTNLFVYMCVKFIIDKASDIPLKLYRYRENGDDEEVKNSPVLDLIENPNPYQDWKLFIQQSFGYYLLTGNNYTWKLPSLTQKLPVELHTLPSQFVDIISGKTWAHPAQAYVMSIFADVKFPAEQIMHFRTPNYNFEAGQYLYGQSPLKSALKTINQSNSTQDAFTKQAQNDGVKGMLMQRESDNVTPLDAQQLKDFKKKIKESINGKDKKGLIEVTNVLFDYVQLGMNSADMQLLESHKVSRNDICAVYNLSSMLFNDNTASTYDNMNTARKSAYTDAIIPLFENWIAKFNKDVVAKYDKNLYLKLDTSGIEELKTDKASLYNALVNAWWIPTSQKQRMSEVEPDGVLPEYLVPGNLFPVDSMSLPPIDEEIDKALKEFGLNKL